MLGTMIPRCSLRWCRRPSTANVTALTARLTKLLFSERQPRDEKCRQPIESTSSERLHDPDILWILHVYVLHDVLNNLKQALSPFHTQLPEMGFDDILDVVCTAAVSLIVIKPPHEFAETNPEEGERASVRVS